MTKNSQLKNLAIIGAFFTPGCFTGSLIANTSKVEKPNVILIISDDQGYGDLSCHGNPWLKTPQMDKLYSQSVRFTDFHVSPTCTPTRAALLTGHYTNRTGAWHTVGGRSLVRESEVLLSEVLKENKYTTGIFGKWHLGDNHPFRPQDRGFDEVLVHGGGGIGQSPDYWGNDYFNDTYFRNGKPEKFNGYCTDVWFDNALNFMESAKSKGKPFFCYLATNAAHGPLNVADKYSSLYKNMDGVINPSYYGMVANLDENMGKLLDFLSKNNLDENTIVIFMTDNGAWKGTGLQIDKNEFTIGGYNAGMRGNKGSEYEGGHRVPFFIRWPAGGIGGGRDIAELTAHIDVMPTLIDLLNLKYHKKINFDGVSLKNILSGKTDSLPSRTIITDSQRLENPLKWKNSATMMGKWRLINGKELFNLINDPEQRTDVSTKYPELVEKLRHNYDLWWTDVSQVFDEYPAITLCDKSEPITILNSMDCHLEGKNESVWNQGQVRNLVQSSGWLAVRSPETRIYTLSLYRYAVEANIPINASAPKSEIETGTSVKPYTAGKIADFDKARITIDGLEFEKKVTDNVVSVSFDVKIEKGFHELKAEFINKDGNLFTAFYTKVENAN